MPYVINRVQLRKATNNFGGGGTIYFAVDGTSYHSGYLCNEGKNLFRKLTCKWFPP